MGVVYRFVTSESSSCSFLVKQNQQMKTENDHTILGSGSVQLGSQSASPVKQIYNSIVPSDASTEESGFPDGLLACRHFSCWETQRVFAEAREDFIFSSLGVKNVKKLLDEGNFPFLCIHSQHEDEHRSALCWLTSGKVTLMSGLLFLFI